MEATDPFDDRRTCLECANLRAGRCMVPRRAGIGEAGLLGELKTTPQRCPGFAERRQSPEPPQRTGWR